jgi:hypothetical protein
MGGLINCFSNEIVTALITINYDFNGEEDV